MSTNPRLMYNRLLERNKRLIVLGSAEAIINWDMETMMPAKAVELRSEQLALLSQINHKIATAPTTGKLLKAILSHPQFDKFTEVEKRNVHLIKKNYDEQTKLPSELVTAIAKQQALTVNIWKKAKAQKNYALFRPELQKLLSLNKKAAEILMKVKETKTPYDALIDIYEPKMTSKEITEVFNILQQGITKLLTNIAEATQPNTSILGQNVPADKQRQIAEMLMQILGYDAVPTPNAAGRLDETEHPFTTGYYDDVRITTHYHSDNFASSIFSVLHETGHALYEQGLPQEWKYQPIGSPCSIGFHESQSRLYENMVGRSLEFWSATLPKIKSIASPFLSNLELASFIQAVNSVKPSKIRIEADEVTYNLHVVIRFQMEKDLFEDKVEVNELPVVWNQKYKKLLGVNVENDSEGVMQDTHWASGLFGYFPTYALGNIYSGQIFRMIQQENSEVKSEIARGNLAALRKWLSNNIYSYGNLYDPEVLIKKVTKNALSVEPYLTYLQVKYGRLYAV